MMDCVFSLFDDVIPIRNEAKMRPDGEFLIVMPYQTGNIHYLPSDTEFIYNCIDGERTVKEIVRLTRREYFLERETDFPKLVLFHLRNLKNKRLVDFIYPQLAFHM